MDFDDYEYDDAQEMQAEARVFERTGQSGKLAELLSVPLEDINKRGAISREDRFLINTDAFCRRLDSENIAKLTETDINNILQTTTKVIELQYKNFVAYVLGYIATQGGKSLKVENVKNVIEKILPQIGDEGGVQGPDIVRYARYWKEFL